MQDDILRRCQAGVEISTSNLHSASACRLCPCFPRLKLSHTVDSPAVAVPTCLEDKSSRRWDFQSIKVGGAAEAVMLPQLWAQSWSRPESKLSTKLLSCPHVSSPCGVWRWREPLCYGQGRTKRPHLEIPEHFLCF